MTEENAKCELSVDTKMSSGVLETMCCTVCFWDGSEERVRLLGALEKVVMLRAVVVKEEEIYLGLNRSSGEGERGGGGDWEALQSLGARSLDIVSAWANTCLYNWTTRGL